METILVALIVVGAMAWAWSDARVAEERAIASVRSLLRGSHVQLLDETVRLDGLRLQRNRRGRLRLARTYAFDLSRDGVTRESGRLTLTADNVEIVDLPEDVREHARRLH